MSLIVALALVTLTGPDGQKIDVNPAEVVTVREPRASILEHIAPGTKCLLHMADGKMVMVVETCDEVRLRLLDERD
jgi:hypothetical protein